MLRFEHDANSTWLEMLFEPIGDLRRHALLHLQVTRVHVDNPSQLRQADDPWPGNVANVRDTGKRQQVMLTERVEGISRTTTNSSYSPSFGNVVDSNGLTVSSSSYIRETRRGVSCSDSSVRS